MPVIDGAGASAGIDASAIASVNNVTNDTASEPVSLSDDVMTSSACRHLLTRFALIMKTRKSSKSLTAFSPYS